MARPRFRAISRHDGDTIELPISEGGTYLCLVCGLDWGTDPPLGENGSASHDICPTCEFHYGYDDDRTKWHPEEPFATRIMRYRTRWLDLIGWDRHAAEQVHAQLGITEVELLNDAAEIRRSSPVKEVRFVTTFGEAAVIKRSEEDNILCPICGVEYEYSALLAPDSLVARHANCPGCNVHNGHAGVFPTHRNPVTPIMTHWAKLRVQWLNRIEWPEWAMARVQHVFGLSREQIVEESA